MDDGRPFNDNRYYISSEKIKKLGWSQNKTKEDISCALRSNKNHQFQNLLSNLKDNLEPLALEFTIITL